MRILLLSPYDADSHRRWRTGLVDALTDFDFVTLALPPRHFRWRLRGNSLSYALAGNPELEQGFDLVVATAMTDLSALRGMQRALATTPALVYFHENQFAYPVGAEQEPWLEGRVLNLYTALAADRIAFNSRFNRDSLLSGVEAMLASMPDLVPAGIAERVRARSDVLPVPLEEACFSSAARGGPFTLLWNHRWEYDKGVDRLLALVRELLDREIVFRIHLLGKRFRNLPEPMRETVELLQQAGKLGECGFVEEVGQYRRLLTQSHIVLSTAIHEFQGLAVLEAVAAGCVPVVPDRLAYPEFIQAQFRYPSGSAAEEARSAANLIVALRARIEAGEQVAPDVTHLRWSRLVDEYRTLMLACVRGGRA